MHRRLGVTVALILTWLMLGLAGCANLTGPRSVTLTQEQMQRLLERQFPRQQRLLEVIDVSVERPMLRLLPERNRIATDLELSATERLSGRTVRGSLALDYALRYEPADGSLRLSQVRVQDVQLEFGGTPLSPTGSRLGALLAEHLLDDVALYRADAERLGQLQRAGITAATISVTTQGIELRFGPQ